MKPLTSILIGPAGCGKSTRVLADYAAQLATGRLGAALWIAPSGRAANSIRERIVALTRSRAVMAPGVHTFAGLATSVVQASRAPVRRIGPLEKRALVARIVEDSLRAGRLRHFAAVAETRGFVDLVTQFIADWKRLEIWPEHFRDAVARKGGTAKDSELLELYETYQARLTERQWFDPEGLIWFARALLRDGQQAPCPRLELLVADGFSDFTRTEHEILELLARRSERALITIPDEEGDERGDLFAKARRTLAQLRNHHPECRVERLAARTGGDWPAMEHLERRLFGHPRRAVPATDTRRLKVLAAGRELGELEQVAAEIKSLLTDGDPDSRARVRPGDIVVVFRSLESAAPLVREVFERCGIPYYLERATALSEAPLVAALVQLLRLHAQDWPHRVLLGVLNQAYCRPAWPDWQPRAMRALELVVREAQLPRGREALRQRCERAAQRASALAAVDETERDQAQLVESAARILRSLQETLSRLPERATADHWLRSLGALAEELGYPRELSVRDAAAWRQLRASVAALSRISEELDASRELSADEFLEWLSDVAVSTPAAQSTDDVGRVRVLSAASVRALEIPYLFVAGLSEKAFPAAAGDGGIYGEAECRRLSEAGLPLVLRAERAEEEMLLFYETITRARRRLYLSYPAIDAKAQPLSPSPYLTEVERAFGGAKVEVERTEDLRPIPSGREVWSERDWRVRAVADALAGDSRAFEQLAGQPESSPLARNLAAGLRVVQARSSGAGFGRFEGMLESAAARRDCAKRFGAERVWSATELETYGACPFRFFMERVLRLAPLPEPELSTDYLARGARMHDVLAALHRHVNLAFGPGTHPQTLDAASYLELVERLLTELVVVDDGDRSLSGALDELQRREMREWLAAYREQHEDYAAKSGHGEAIQPLYFEAAFGMGGTRREDEPARDDISVDDCLELRRGDDVVRVAGRIDRIDVAEVDGQVVFNVLDYKTGKRPPKKEEIVSGRLLQLPLYALAVERLLLAEHGASPWQVGYWFLSERGYQGQLQLAAQAEGRVERTEVWKALIETIEAKVFALVRGMRHAEFPMHNLDDKCTSHCDYREACRVNQVRALGKTWAPPEEQPRD